jgi:hypothetical protein
MTWRITIAPNVANDDHDHDHLHYHLDASKCIWTGNDNDAATTDDEITTIITTAPQETTKQPTKGFKQR